MTSGIVELAAGVSADLQRRLPGQRKTQRDKLALLVATMLDARSANLMVLAASLPRAAERADMRYQWIARFIDNDRVVCDDVMKPFACEVADCRRAFWTLDLTLRPASKSTLVPSTRTITIILTGEIGAS